MNMNKQPKEVISDKLKALAKEAECPLMMAPDETRKWLAKSSGLSDDIVDFMSSSWPGDTFYFGPYRLDTLSDISDSERAKIAFAGGFFYIGAAGNGDLLVIRRASGGLADCDIGLISHEELWEKERNLGSIYEPICRGFKELIERSETEDSLPLDYYDAKERKAKHSQSGPRD